MIDAALACGRADHLRFWDEMTPEEWSWLEAYRSEFGLPEDRLRFYFAVAIHFLSSASSPPGIMELMDIMNPFGRASSEGRGPGGERAASSEPQELSPRQHALLVSSFIASRRGPDEH